MASEKEITDKDGMESNMGGRLNAEKPLVKQVDSRGTRPTKLQPWHHHLTLDTLMLVLSRTFLHPIAFPLLSYLSLAAVHKHKTPVARFVIAWSVCLWVWTVLSWINRRVTYGRARKVEWADEVVVVTGGATGLGAVLVEVLVRRGVAVAVLDVKEAVAGEMREWVEEGRDGIGGSLKWFICDVGEREDVVRCMAEIRDQLGTPTILINNAATPISGLPIFPSNDESQATLSPTQVSRTLTVNTLGNFHLLYSFLSSLSSAENGITIVTISSILAHLAPASLADYAASKAAVSSFHHTLTHEIRLAGQQDRVKTVLVEIGQMATGLFANVRTPWYAHFIGPVLEVNDVANAIFSLIDTGNSGVIRLPVYAKLMVWYPAMPGTLQWIIRWFSGIDRAIHSQSRVEAKST